MFCSKIFVNVHSCPTSDALNSKLLFVSSVLIYSGKGSVTVETDTGGQTELETTQLECSWWWLSVIIICVDMSTIVLPGPDALNNIITFYIIALDDSFVIIKLDQFYWWLIVLALTK